MTELPRQQAWQQPLLQLLRSLLDRGTIRVVKSSDRWASLLPGFHAVCHALVVDANAVTQAALSSLPAATPPGLINSHSAMLLRLASLACASAGNATTDTWTFSTQKDWDVALLTSLVHNIAAQCQATATSGTTGHRKRERSGGLDSPPPAPLGVPADVATATSASVRGSTGASASLQGSAPRDRRVGQDAAAGEQEDDDIAAGTAPSPVLIPTDLPDTHEVPAPLRALLQIARLLHSPVHRCDNITVAEDGSVLVTLRPLKSHVTECDGFQVINEAHTVRFAGVVDEAALRRATNWYLDPCTGQETTAYQSWRARISSSNLVFSLWIPFPCDFVDSSSLAAVAQMPFPSQCDPRITCFHPMLRWHEDYWNVYCFSVQGRLTQAWKRLFYHGALAAIDIPAWAVLAQTLTDAGLPGLAERICRVILPAIEERRSSLRSREMLLYGGLSTLANMVPDAAMASFLHDLQIRLWRKLGQDDPELLRKAGLATTDLLVVEHQTFDLLIRRCSTLLTDAHVKAIELRMQAALPILADHEAFARAAREGYKLRWLLACSEQFAVLRTQRAPASMLYQLARTRWEPGSATIIWEMTPGVIDTPPLALGPDSFWTTLAASQYARAIASASDATLEHVQDAQIKAEHAYSVRLAILGANHVSTSKTRRALDSLRDRADELAAAAASSSTATPAAVSSGSMHMQ